MGISSELTAAMIREGKHRPFSGTVYTLGRQTMSTTPQETIKMFDEIGLRPAISDLSGLRVDSSTHYAINYSTKSTILDIDFFRMLGFEQVKAVDISDFEGAEIVHDLNEPIPDSLEATCDLVVDGSLLDNIFDPVTGLKNLARMLKPGGRAFLINAANAPADENARPYTIFNPMWFFDYFVWNNFNFCQAYCMVDYQQRASMYEISYDHAARRWDSGQIKTLHVPEALVVCIFAEKGVASTWDRKPIQHAYRPESHWKRYEDIVNRFSESARTPLMRPSCDDYFPRSGVPSGWNRIHSDGTLTQPPGT